jgi:hypothetical protein
VKGEDATVIGVPGKRSDESFKPFFFEKLFDGELPRNARVFQSVSFTIPELRIECFY